MDLLRRSSGGLYVVCVCVYVCAELNCMLAEVDASSVYTKAFSRATSDDLHCVPAQADHTYLQLKKDLDYLDLKVRLSPPSG